MPLSVLKLGQFQLDNRADSLTISVSSFAHFQLPQIVSALDDGAFVEALRLRDVWVTRGKSCHIGIKICVDGKRLQDNQRVRVLESLGYRLRNASLWNKLELSTSLDVTLNDKPGTPDILIGLKQRTSTIGEVATGGDLVDIKDLRPPNSIMCCELEKITIHLNILTTRDDVMLKRMKTWHSKTDSEWMLSGLSDEKVKLDALNHIANKGLGLQGASSCITKVFEPALFSNTKEDHILLGNAWESKPNLAGALGISTTRPSVIEPEINTETRLCGERQTFPSMAAGVVRSWLDEHADNSNPAHSQKEVLMKITRPQQFVAFIESKSSSTGLNSEDKMLLAVSNVEPEDPEMLLTPSLISQSSTISNASLALSIFSSPKRRSPTNVPADCSADSSSMKDLAAASAIGEATLNIIVSGYIGQSGENLDKLKVESALGSPLSSLVPTMFNPGFQKFMASNSVYLSTVSNAVSITWTRTAQSPSLRQKLEQLANERTSALIHGRLEHTKEGTSERLSAVVQTRIWAMMQNHLYGRLAARKIWDKNSVEKNDKPEMDADPSQKIPDDDDHEFCDLLRDTEDDDLLDYMAKDEREGLAVEQETEELLLEGVWRDGQFLMDIDGSQGDDSMLL